MPFHRYVALGDSFTEGVGDDAPDLPNGVRGWADRAAAVLAEHEPDLVYANLAIRGRKLDAIIAEQVEPALSLRPDLVSVYAGANDILRPRVDVDALVGRYDAALARIAASGAHLVVFTAHDRGPSTAWSVIRGRFALYNELVREVADRHAATVVDFWRMREYRDLRLWSEDRIHMSPPGHRRMAEAFLDALGLGYGRAPDAPGAEEEPGPGERRGATLAWARAHAAPWVGRRLTGSSSGDGLDPRWPELVRPRGSTSPAR